MGVRYTDMPVPISTLEDDINSFFDGIIMCVNARRMSLLASAEEMRNVKAERLRRRTEGSQQLEATKAEIERLMEENILRETQEKLLRKVTRKLEEVRTSLPATRILFRGEYGHMEQLTAALGEIREEEISAVPRYETMRPIVAVWKEGKAPGELKYPKAVAIDYNTKYIFVVEGSPFSASHPPIQNNALFPDCAFPRISVFSDGR